MLSLMNIESNLRGTFKIESSSTLYLINPLYLKSTTTGLSLRTDIRTCAPTRIKGSRKLTDCGTNAISLPRKAACRTGESSSPKNLSCRSLLHC